MQSKSNHQPELHILTDKVMMKFTPKFWDQQAVSKSTLEQPVDAQATGLLSWLRGKSQNNSMNNSMTSASEQKTRRQVSGDNTEPRKTSSLKFLERISAEHILIGNEKQLDLINISGINSCHFVDTEYMWSFTFKEDITLVNVDTKKYNLLTIVTGKTLYIYKYDFKKLTDPITPFKKIGLDEKPVLMQIVKEGNICLFFSKKMEVFLASDQVRKKYSKPYNSPPLEEEGTEYTLFAVPNSYQNILNVFFEETKPSKDKIFTLWCLEYEFLANQIRDYLPQKIYEIKKSFRSSLRLTNFSKQIFYMNLGSEILALKKGYVLDSATVNLKTDNSTLVYVGKETLFHISSKKIQVYNFELITTVKPYRIKVFARDSITIDKKMPNQVFFKVIDVLNSDFAFFFQADPKKNMYKRGEIGYSFYITRAIKRKEKLNQIFPRLSECSETYKLDDPRLMQKCDMAQKMGLTIRQIYLQLWNRSTQDKPNDYSLLIATKDYKTIKEEVIRKLKKKAMNFKEIKNIEDACFSMLEERVFGTSCTEQAVMEYITSHFLKRKLEMFKDIYIMDRYNKEKEIEMAQADMENQAGEKDENRKEEFRMTIREYQNYRSMEIKQEVISLVSQFCHEDKKSFSKNIRFLLRNFKFVFRIIYHELLGEIIEAASHQILVLLTEIPELLPYTPPEEERPINIPPGYYEGVWTSISNREWDDSLYIDAISTIDNKEVMTDVIKSISFRRNWLSLHDMVIDSRESIIKNSEKIKSEQTFFYFIAKVFEQISEKEVLRELIDFIELTYENIPSKIRGKIFLLHTIYCFFCEKNIVPTSNNHPILFSEFLNFEDYELIKHCFDKERSMKGLILKDIKTIFSQEGNKNGNKEGDSHFNQALLNYFISPLSSVSDLKYILNRINNQKTEFHDANQEMYEILVEAIERKLKLGSGNDIPIEEVMIYIQNIPITSNDPGDNKPMPPHLLELKTIEKLNKEAELLKNARVNMSLYDILRKPDEVFTKLVNYAVDSSNVEEWMRETEESDEKMDEFAYRINAVIEGFSEQIYDKNNSFVIFFIFLNKICENTGLIRQANRLLQNEHMREICYDDSTAEGLVQYMYKWKLSSCKVIVENETYIKELLKLLSEDSVCHAYISAEFEYAQILSNTDNPVEFPITDSILCINDVKALIKDLQVEFVMQINLQNLHECILKMQEIVADEHEGEDSDFGPANFITLHQIYEIVIVKIINSGKLKDSLRYIRHILQLEIFDDTYNIIYPILFIIFLSVEINELNKNNLIECVFHYFYSPLKLLDILDHIANTPLNPREMKEYIQQSLAEGKKLYKGYNPGSKVFNPIYMEAIQTPIQAANFMATLQKTTKHMQQAKEEFKYIKYAVIMAMLSNSPFALAKLISCSDEKNVRSIRSFLSYAIMEEIFEPFSLLELGRRIFMIVLLTEKQKLPIEVLIEQYSEIPLDCEMEIDFNVTEDKQTFQYAMWKSAEAFKKKKISLFADLERRSKEKNSKEESVMEKSQRIKVELQIVPNIEERAPSEYPFSDSDNEADNVIEIKSDAKKRKELPEFDPSEERKNAMQKDKKRNGMLFMSSRGEINPDKKNLSVSIRNNYRTSIGNIETGIQSKSLGIKIMNSKSAVNKFSMMSLEQSQEYGMEDYDSPAQSQRKSSFLQIDPDSASNRERSALSSPHINTDEQVKEQGVIIEMNEENDQSLQKNKNILEVKENPNLQNSVISAVSDPYNINVKEVNEMYEDDLAEVDEEIMFDIELGSSCQFAFPIQTLALNVLEANAGVLDKYGRSFDLGILEKFSTDTQTLKGTMIEIFRACPEQKNMGRILQMITQICTKFPACNVSKESIDLIAKTQNAHSIRIHDIPFADILVPELVVQNYGSEDEIFEAIYPKLQQNANMENILKIQKFVEKMMSSNKLRDRIYWDFILKLPQSMDNQIDDKVHLIEQVKYGCLPKIEIAMMNERFDEFQAKVLNSGVRKQFIQLFCKALMRRQPKAEVIQFMKKLKSVDDNIKITEALDILSPEK